MTKFKEAELVKIADKAGISIGLTTISQSPTIEQLMVFADEVRLLERARCAALCSALGKMALASSSGATARGAAAMARSCVETIETT